VSFWSNHEETQFSDVKVKKLYDLDL